MSPPGFLLPRISELGVSFNSEEHERESTEHSQRRESSRSSLDSQESNKDHSTEDSREVFVSPKLLSGSLMLPSIEGLDLSGSELLEDDDMSC